MKPTYDEKFDKFGNLHVPNELGALYLLGPAVLLAMFIHPYVLVPNYALRPSNAHLFQVAKS